MLELLRTKNPDLKIYSVNDAEFSDYGRVVADIDVSELISVAEGIENPEGGGSMYVASEERLERLPIAEEIADKIFGTLPIELGYCWGHSNYLNAVEWHTSSEVNVAVTPLVLILGKRSDLSDGRLDSSVMKAFFVPKGTVIEVYATTLHFCPCEVQSEGFGCVVALPEGTNLPLDSEVEDKLLFRKNKWLIAHNENAALIARGAMPGLGGKNYKLSYQE
ncbi:MAG: DUF4867 family protein [Clostridia bacterium]|nr:DUF4867 family protein [Clostridia bacterium]